MLNEQELKEYAQLMSSRFLKDPGFIAQIGDWNLRRCFLIYSVRPKLELLTAKRRTNYWRIAKGY